MTTVFTVTGRQWARVRKHLRLFIDCDETELCLRNCVISRRDPEGRYTNTVTYLFQSTVRQFGKGQKSYQQCRGIRISKESCPDRRRLRLNRGNGIIMHSILFFLRVLRGRSAEYGKQCWTEPVGDRFSETYTAVRFHWGTPKWSCLGY